MSCNTLFDYVSYMTCLDVVEVSKALYIPPTMIQAVLWREERGLPPIAGRADYVRGLLEEAAFGVFMNQNLDVWFNGTTHKRGRKLKEIHIDMMHGGWIEALESDLGEEFDQIMKEYGGASKYLTILIEEACALEIDEQNGGMAWFCGGAELDGTAWSCQ